MTTKTLPRACWYRSGNEWKGGTLHAWGQCADESGAEPVGVIEDDKTMICTTVPVDRICFASVPPIGKHP